MSRNEYPSTHQAQVDFGSELGFGSCFAPHDGTHMGLVDADYPVIHLMGTLLKHGQLLGIDGLDDPILPLKGGIQGKDLELVQLFFYCLEVPSQVLELGFNPGLPVDFAGWCLLNRLTRSSHGI